MNSYRLSDKKATKRRNHGRSTSIEEPSLRPKVEEPVKRGKSFIEKLRTFRLSSKNRTHSSGDDTATPSPIPMRPVKSEDNLLSPPSNAQPIDLSAMSASTPVSRENSPECEGETVVSIEISPEAQEYYNQKFVFDEIKEFLATRPDEEEEASASVLDEFDPEEHPWRKEESAIEQLRGFLATCP